MWCSRHICSGAYANNMKCTYTTTCGHIVDCKEFIWGIYIDTVVSCGHVLMGTCGLHVEFERHISFLMYMGITCFLSEDTDGAINDTTAFVMLRWLFRSIIQLLLSVLVPVLALGSCLTDNAIGITWPKKSCCISFKVSWPKEGNGTISIIWCQYQCKGHHMTNKSYWTSFWLSWANKCSCANDNAINITWCQCQHQCIPRPKKGHVEPHVQCLDLKNTPVPLMMDMCIMWCKCWYHWCHLIKTLCCNSFSSSWPKECNGATDNAVCSTWCWHWHQSLYVNKDVMLQLILIILT